MIKPAPILLFTYKRLDALKNTIAALKKNDLASESDLFIFSDGPKQLKDKDIIDQIRTFLKTVDGFKSVTISASPTNKGLANSIIGGVTTVMEKSETVIVLEDDLLTTPNFLTYMNKALSEYTAEKKIFSISGYSFDLRSKDQNPNTTYLLNRGWSWGWATWRDRWENVDWEVASYKEFSENKLERKEFAKGGSDLNAMLDKQMSGKLDSWAIRWFYHQFKTGGLTLYPLGSKIYNDGFDEFATHTNGSEKRYLPYLDKEHQMNFNFPKEIAISKEYQKKFQSKMGIIARIKSKIEGFFK
ncbi:glycosyltransferase [Cellulophaga sp. HaHa_2_95]|uniref:glycosyltransferase n=1 Tax=unclassified Cellulophaga TaxID=2634405 RepID=UPI001C4F41B3|nr:glycosyltransferase [Cellulophaga sp. HaHa_2_95]QXP56891.1 glycosyltransferase [Cellulophaga sp. HaHa_2_95]